MVGGTRCCLGARSLAESAFRSVAGLCSTRLPDHPWETDPDPKDTSEPGTTDEDLDKSGCQSGAQSVGASARPRPTAARPVVVLAAPSQPRRASS